MEGGSLKDDLEGGGLRDKPPPRVEGEGFRDDPTFPHNLKIARVLRIWKDKMVHLDTRSRALRRRQGHCRVHNGQEFVRCSPEVEAPALRLKDDPSFQNHSQNCSAYFANLE